MPKSLSLGVFHRMSKDEPSALNLAPCPAIFMWDGGGLNVLIPKRRGSGYLRVPYGHHNDPKLNRIADAIRAEICGLDGYLGFEIPKVANLTRHDRTRIVSTVLPLLAAHFHFSQWREDPKAFWAVLLPNTRHAP